MWFGAAEAERETVHTHAVFLTMEVSPPPLSGDSANSRARLLRSASDPASSAFLRYYPSSQLPPTCVNGDVLVLASQSPRRRDILTNAGIPFMVRPAGISEVRRPGEDAAQYVRRLAFEKASAIERCPDEHVLSADTVVVVSDEILEKPRDSGDATRMLRLLSGREHRVLTGICLLGAAATVIDTEATRVRFVALSDREISAYVSSGEPMDKAGGYAIQGLASKFIDRIEGCYFNVMGLPIALVYRHLKEAGFKEAGLKEDGFV